MSVNMFGYSIQNVSLQIILDRLLVSKKEKKFHRVVTLNPEMLVLAERNLIIKTWLAKADTIVSDGYGLKWASRFLRHQDLEIVTGVQLVFSLLKQKNLTFYFVGASEKIVEQSVSNTKRLYPDVDVVGSSHGYFTEFDVPNIIKSIMAKKPDVILVGMGFPKQEYFIQTLAQYCESGIAIGIGGVFDILSGSKSLAPNWIRLRGLEWLFRSFQNPKRIFRWKYLVYFLVFTFQHFFSSEET